MAHDRSAWKRVTRPGPGRLAAALLALGAGALSLGAVPAAWAAEVATYLAPQSDLAEPYPGLNLSVGAKEFREQTLRQIARISVGGEGLRLRFGLASGQQRRRAPSRLSALAS